MITDETRSDKRCGFVCVMGNPNVGKSTLVNALVGSHISIVSKRVQTTQTTILGTYVFDQTQIILMDTPGIFDHQNPFKGIRSTKTADLFLWVFDATKPLFTPPVPALCVINKIDLVSNLNHLNAKFDPPPFYVSAKNQLGLDLLSKTLAKQLPVGPFLYPVDPMANKSHYAQELTRETLFEVLDHELPYETFVETEKFEVLANGSFSIYQTIGVFKKSQKKILVGKNGQKIKDIGIKSRKKIEENFGSKVHLFLFVKVFEKDDK